MALGDPLAYFSFSTRINRTLVEMIDSTLYDASDGCIVHQMQIPSSCFALCRGQDMNLERRIAVSCLV